MFLPNFPLFKFRSLQPASEPLVKTTSIIGTSSHREGKTLQNKPLLRPLPLYPFEYVNSLFMYGTIGMSLDPNDDREREWATGQEYQEHLPLAMLWTLDIDFPFSTIITAFD